MKGIKKLFEGKERKSLLFNGRKEEDWKGRGGEGRKGSVRAWREKCGVSIILEKKEVKKGGKR